EKDMWMHFNYIHHNPVKHGYVRQMEDWQYSSFQYYLRKYGMKWIMSCFESYPIIDFSMSWQD
ncbi:MAG: transposase, partial [bacterium]